jgi:hypothetical protein
MVRIGHCADATPASCWWLDLWPDDIYRKGADRNQREVMTDVGSGGHGRRRDWRARWHVALLANLVALGGVLLGIAALAVGCAPRTKAEMLIL